MGQLENLGCGVNLTVGSPASGDGSMFGSGIAHLCLGVRELGSLNAAAKRMGMAYSKAWRIIRETEAALGVALLNRDGAHGSALTPDGNWLLDTYLAIEKALQAEAERMYRERLAKEPGEPQEARSSAQDFTTCLPEIQKEPPMQG